MAETGTPKARRGPNGWLAAIAAVTIGVVLAAIIGWGGDDGSDSIWVLLGLAFGVNWIVWVPSLLRTTERFFDLTGSVTYLTCLVAAAFLADRLGGRDLLVIALVATWTIRLGVFLFRRVLAAGSDGRFDQIKVDPAQSFMTWTLQGLWAFVTAIAAFVVILSDRANELDVFALAGAAVWLGGFAVETIADQQKRRFAADPRNRGRFITSGLWAWSRHPNYFGEIVLWCGIAIIALPVFRGGEWAALISPMFVTLLLTRVSGLPMLERRARAKWGDEPEYQRYVERTPVLLMRPPRRS